MGNPFPSDDRTCAIYGVDTVPDPRTLVDIFRETVHHYPNATALIGTNESLTYSQLAERIDDQVERLAQLGIGRGARIGIRVPSGTTDLYIAILATICAGAAYVPVDWDDPDSRANTVWEEANATAVYGAELSLDLRGNDLTPVTPCEPTTADDAWIIFTSGSTGKPKGVAVSHRSAAALVDAEARMYLVNDPLGPQDRVMAGLSVAFDASCEEMWLAWRYGAALVPAPRDIVRSADALGEWITRNKISAVSTVPTLASFWPTESLAAVRLLIFGGEALPVELVNRLAAPGRELWNTYGPTEATIICSGHLMKPMTDKEPVRIGRPVPGWQLAIVDPETGEPVRWGETGELLVTGVGLGRYLDQEKDAEAYAPLESLGWERAYRTGDLVVAEQEGIIFAGRADDQIKFGGRRMELGEIDRALASVPGVAAAAAAKQTTTAGSDVIIGYVVPEEDNGKPGTIDLHKARTHLSTVLPGGIAPTLCIVNELPMKTSGKVDRKALPWPLPDSRDSVEALPQHLRWLADKWIDQLGPVPIEENSSFFDLGGSSVAIAKLAIALRESHPALDIGALYDNPTLSMMADYVDTLHTDTEQRPLPQKIPWWSGIVQFLVVCGIYAVNVARYVVGTIFVVWALGFFFSAAWVPTVPFWPVFIGMVVLFSTPGKILQAAIVARVATFRIQPGDYPRGGWTHLRIWSAERFLAYLRLDPLLDTPSMSLLFRLFGCTVGKGTTLATFPPVTGLATIGEGSVLENEVDINGHWIDGDTFYLRPITIGDRVRVGMRTFVSPGSTIGDDVEIIPGSCVTGAVAEGRCYSGNPLSDNGPSRTSWPSQTPKEAIADGMVTGLGFFSHHLLYILGLSLLNILPVLAVLPATFLILPTVINNFQYQEVFLILAAWTPFFAILTIVCWLALVVILVRLCSLLIRPGYFPIHSSTGWALWMTHTLLQKTLTSTYFVYAGWLTPAFLRLLGARVGKDTEISTVETIPHLTAIGDRCFLADHSMCTSARYNNGWVHVGTTVLGDGSFVGNSGIVGPDHDLPAESLVAVLSSTPERPGKGTSWLGRSTRQIPRAHIDADLARTFNPSTGLKVARAFVELFRLLPVIVAAYLDLLIVWLGTLAYMSGGRGWGGIQAVLLWAFPIVLGAGIIASLVPIVLKWLLIGRFTAGHRTLFSTFVWRGELIDNIAELLAVPSLIRMSLGSPLYNWWLRLMGTRIGRDVWCETWWLPEFDLITLSDRSTINRGTVLQTHLFHDRVMALETVTMGTGATLGPNSFILPGSSIGDRATIGPGSLILRQDAIPNDSVWSGNPVSYVEDPKSITAFDSTIQDTHPKEAVLTS